MIRTIVFCVQVVNFTVALSLHLWSLGLAGFLVAILLLMLHRTPECD